MRIKDEIKVKVKPNRSELFVIPGLTEPAPYLIRGNPVFSRININAEVHPVCDTGQE